jgi:hypothetical protein
MGGKLPLTGATKGERRQPDIRFGGMDAFYIERMKSRLVNMRKVAALSHDPRIIQLATDTADQLEEDIGRLEAEASVGTTIHIKPSSHG